MKIPPEPINDTRTERIPSQTDEGRSAAIGAMSRVLVVDDMRDSATTMATLLKALGNEAWMAHDGIEAVEAAERFRPEVVLMDLGMPRLNGYEATRRIREQPWGQRMFLIALTGWGTEYDKAKSREAGCDGHLVKPIVLEDLEKLLTELALKRDHS